MIKCLTCNLEFEDYAYQEIFWSGDSIPCCPICGTTIYNGEFEKAIEIEIPINNKDRRKYGKIKQ